MHAVEADRCLGSSANPANMMNNVGIQTDTVEVCNTATTQVSRQTLWKCATLEVSKE